MRAQAQAERSSSDTGLEMSFHPTHLVPDLHFAAQWFRRVFGVESFPTYPTARSIDDGFAVYSPIRDVLFDSLCPERLEALLGIDIFPRAGAPHLSMFGWYVDQDRIGALYQRMKSHGIRAASQDGRIGGDEAPCAPGAPARGFLAGRPSFVTFAEETGLVFHFVPTSRGMADYPGRGSHIPVDRRLDPGWALGPVDVVDPLGIERCSHHTILTHDMPRALHFAVTVLGGRIVHEGRDDLRQLTCTYVHLADGILAFCIPDRGSEADEDWHAYPVCAGAAEKTLDTYHAITWKVADLEKTESHLESQGIIIRARSPDTIITDPGTSLGIPWGFTTQTILGAPRFQA